MTLKGHKNLIANGATATGLPCWRPGVFVAFGLVNPDTLATSTTLCGMSKETLRDRDQQGSSIERPSVGYLFRRQ
jgi:hypothetical protein